MHIKTKKYSIEDIMHKNKGTEENPWCPECFATVILALLEEIPIDRDKLQKLNYSVVGRGEKDEKCLTILNKLEEAISNSNFEEVSKLAFQLKYHVNLERRPHESKYNLKYNHN